MHKCEKIAPLGASGISFFVLLFFLLCWQISFTNKTHDADVPLKKKEVGRPIKMTIFRHSQPQQHDFARNVARTPSKAGIRRFLGWQNTEYPPFFEGKFLVNPFRCKIGQLRIKEESGAARHLISCSSCCCHLGDSWHRASCQRGSGLLLIGQGKNSRGFSHVCAILFWAHKGLWRRKPPENVPLTISYICFSSAFFSL